MRPDKKSITDEVWDDARVKSFLVHTAQPCTDDPDFVLLLNAYRGMRVDDFARFIRFFREARHDLNAKNEQGQCFVEFIAAHRHGRPFIDVMIAAGARADGANSQ